MRAFLLSAAAISMAAMVSAPAHAASETQRDMERMADRLGNPATQDAMAGAFGAMLGAVLDIRVDGIAKALEPMNGGKRVKLKGNTIREIATRNDPRFEEKMEDNGRAMVGGLGAMAGALAQAMPQLEAAMEKMGDAMDEAKSRSGRTN